MLSMNRRGMNSGMNPQSAMDDGWKGVPDSASLLSGPNNAAALNPDGPNQNAFPPTGIPYNSSGSQYPQTGQSSPAGNQSLVYQNSNQPGSNTPQYTSSPAPSGT